MYLQNKQENGGVAPVASPMPKLVLEIWREKRILIFQSRVSYLVRYHPLFFMEEGRCPLSLEVDDFLLKRKGNVALCLRVMTCSSL